MREALALVLVTATALAGCTGAIPDAPVPAARADWALAALESAHDHTDRWAHANVTTPNFEVVGWTPLVSAYYGTTVQGALCGDVAESPDGRRLAAVQARGDVVFTLADVTDPARPEWLGELVMRTTYVYDLAALPDGKHVALVTSSHKSPERLPDGVPAGDGLYWRSPCGTNGEWRLVAAPGDDVVPRPRSLVLVSVEDPSAPAIVDQRPLGGLGHGVSAARVGERVVVVAAALGCTTAGFGVAVPVAPVPSCPAATASWYFYEVGEAGVLEPLSVFSTPVEASESFLRRGNHHNDAWIAEHPVTGRALAYLASWDDGLLILDVGDPRAPELVGRWNGFDPTVPEEGNVHSAFPFPGLVKGRHFTLVGPEHSEKPEATPSGVVFVLDTTDPASPVAVAGWTLPHESVWEEPLQYSLHYLSAVGRTAFVSAYHAGVWALDLSDVSESEWTLLPAVGVFMPLNVSPAPPERPIRWAPTVEEVLPLPDGTLVTFDSNSGLYAFRFDASRPAPSPEAWPLAPPQR